MTQVEILDSIIKKAFNPRGWAALAYVDRSSVWTDYERAELRRIFNKESE